MKIKGLLFGNKCHTLDRYNFPSKLDTCSQVDINDIQEAIEKDFDVNHWPYVQNATAKYPSTIRECFYKMNKYSWFNLQKVGAVMGHGVSAAMLMIGTLVMVE